MNVPSPRFLFLLGILAAGSVSGARAGTAVPPPVTGPLSLVSEQLLRIRDPFKAPNLLQGETARSEVESLSIDRLKLVAVIRGNEGGKAMVSTPDGRTFIVTEKMKIGNSQGVVTKIEADGITVTEKFTNALGQEEREDTLIRIGSDSHANPLRPAAQSQSLMNAASFNGRTAPPEGGPLR